MYSIITIFYISLIGIILMILLKRREIKSGRPSLVARLGKGTDHAFHKLFSGVRRAIAYLNRKTFITLAQWLAFHVLLRIRKIYVEGKDKALANPHSRKVIDAVRGRADIKHHGASFYLRRINDK
ncbi:MAG: hypothetical protein WC648_01515 [Candidatus Paceibacterota bacterium]|jgi:preprotein translocase subunit SecG